MNTHSVVKPANEHMHDDSPGKVNTHEEVKPTYKCMELEGKNT